MRQSLDFARRPAGAIQAASGAGPFDPRQLPALSAWLNWATASDSGTLSVPDLMGGSPATQSTGGLKPVISATTNGVTVAAFNSSVLSLPLSAAINNNTKFGVAFWVKLSGVVGVQTFLSVQNVAGGASADKLLCNTFGATLETRAQSVDRRAGITSLDTNWRFCYIGIDCSKGTEATQVIEALDGLLGTVTFSSDTAWPASLGTPTGNMLIGSTLTTGLGSPLVGSIGDIYFFLDQLTSAEIGRLMNFNRPL